MFHVRRIESLDLPGLEPYRTMRRPVEHREQGIFVAEGEKVVRRLLQSDFHVISVLLPEKWLKDYEPLLEARREPEIPVYVAELRILEELVGFPLFQGVLAVGRLPQLPSLAQVLQHSPKPRLLVAVDGISNAENIGVIVRTCAAFNTQALIVGETSSSPFLRRAVRNSMGAIFRLPIIESLDLAGTLRELRADGIRIVAAHPRSDAQTLEQADLTEDCCIIFGSEGHGISDTVLQACDQTVVIPMPPDVDSLNVNAAAAVFLHEASRQRLITRNPIHK